MPSFSHSFQRLNWYPWALQELYWQSHLSSPCGVFLVPPLAHLSQEQLSGSWAVFTFQGEEQSEAVRVKLACSLSSASVLQLLRSQNS